MKVRTLLLGLIFALSASAQASIVTVEQIGNAQLIAAQVNPMALINWKVGDAQDYQVDLGIPGLSGTMHKEATKEEGDGIWMHQEMKLPVMNDTSDILLDRHSGKVLKFIHNGKEEAYPNEPIKVVSTKNESIQVPAGTFRVMHITAQSKSVQDIEIWANPRQISLDGAAKMYMDQGTIKITMELTKFVKN